MASDCTVLGLLVRNLFSAKTWAQPQALETLLGERVV